jgi:hypothetical protein
MAKKAFKRLPLLGRSSTPRQRKINHLLSLCASAAVARTLAVTSASAA